MLILEDLLNGNDLISRIFTRFLVKNGQLTTDSIFYHQGVDQLRDELFFNIFKPLLQFSDCYIRIKDFGKLEFSFVFILKEPTHRGISKKFLDSEKMNIREMVEYQMLKVYRNEIMANNFKKMVEYLSRTNYRVENEEILLFLSQNLIKVLPFQKHRINISSQQLFDLFFPQWEDYFDQLILKAKATIQKKIESVQLKNSVLTEMIQNHKLYWNRDKKELPFFNEVYQSLEKEVDDHIKVPIQSNQILNFLLDQKKFMGIKIDRQYQNKAETKGQLKGITYSFKRDYHKIMITANDKPVGKLDNNNIYFFQKKIKELFNFDVRIQINQVYNEKEQIRLFYTKKAVEVIENIISDKNIVLLKVVLYLFKEGYFQELKKLYYNIILDLINKLEQIKVNEAIAYFIKNNSRQSNFLVRLYNYLFSPWKESLLTRNIEQEKKSIHELTQSIVSDMSKNFGEVISPIDAALKIIKSDLKLDEIKAIIQSKSAGTSHKVDQILNLYRTIGNTNKAFIKKDEESMKDFLKQLIQFINFYK